MDIQVQHIDHRWKNILYLLLRPNGIKVCLYSMRLHYVIMWVQACMHCICGWTFALIQYHTLTFAHCPPQNRLWNVGIWEEELRNRMEASKKSSRPYAVTFKPITYDISHITVIIQYHITSSPEDRSEQASERASEVNSDFQMFWWEKPRIIVPLVPAYLRCHSSNL